MNINSIDLWEETIIKKYNINVYDLYIKLKIKKSSNN